MASSAPVGPPPTMGITRDSCAQRERQKLSGGEHVRKRIVQGDWRQAQHVRFPPIADQALRGELLWAALRLGGGARNPQTQLTAPLLRGRGGNDFDQARQALLDEALHEPCQCDGLLAQRRQTCTLN